MTQERDSMAGWDALPAAVRAAASVASCGWKVDDLSALLQRFGERYTVAHVVMTDRLIQQARDARLRELGI